MTGPDAAISLAPHGIVAVLILVIGFLLKHELKDIKSRIVRVENFLFFSMKGEKKS